MALANFFNKTALAASQILNGYDRENFEKKLMAAPVEIAFDRTAVHSSEGTATLDLTTRLLARLYPKLIINPLDADSETCRQVLEHLAKSINPEIELCEEVPFATIVVGDTAVDRKENVFYVGSDNWTVYFSAGHVVPSGNSQIPFAAGAAACFGVANIFRTAFKDQLPKGDIDEDFALSLINFESNPLECDFAIDDKIINVGESFLIGLGAIGNGTLWALTRLKNLLGKIHIIDHEKIELSNLQRYVLATQEDDGKYKITLCNKYNPVGIFLPFQGNWVEFLAKRQDWKLPLVMLAVDSAKDRIAIQSSLPRQIINAWTQPSDLGISRHSDFLNEACVVCIYPPRIGGKSDSELIAGALGLLHEEPAIRTLVYNNSPLNEGWIRKIAEAKDHPYETLQPYIGLPISEFYHDVLCGGLVMTDADNRHTETPMAFQSALAGILLASEFVISAANLRTTRIDPITRINLLQPLTKYLNEPLLKTTLFNCVCHDEDFKHQYTEKYKIGGNK